MSILLIILSWLSFGFLCSIFFEYDYHYGNKLINSDCSDDPVNYNWYRILHGSFFGYLMLIPAVLIIFLHQDDVDVLDRVKQEKQLMKNHIDRVLKDKY